MSDIDASWSTTTPGARVATGPEKVPAHDALAPGTRLDEFEIVRVLGTGGFGIVYLARDHVLLREVAIKEYMPAALAGRGEHDAVSLRSSLHGETFARGLESFLSEARLLASFDHPSLVKVHRFWRSNATAYMAMQYYPGPTLKDARVAMDGAPDAAWLATFVEPLLGALDLLHGQGVFHRDISPDNIVMLADGQPVLLDFGSARRVVANSTQSITAHLKPQFAPLEQYADDAGVQQGPWTDLYSLGATLYFVLTGRAPTPSVVRAVRDVLPTLSASPESMFPGVPARLLATVDWMLALAPHERPQGIALVRKALTGEIVVPAPSPRESIVTSPDVPAAPAAPAPESTSHEATAAGLRSAGEQVPVASDPPTPAGPEAGQMPEVAFPEDIAARPRFRPGRRTGLSALASLAVMGAATLGWGAWTFSRPVPVFPTEAGVVVDPAKPPERVSWPADPGLAPVAMAESDAAGRRLAPNPPEDASIAAASMTVVAAAATQPSLASAPLRPPPPKTSGADRGKATARQKAQSARTAREAAARHRAAQACQRPTLLERAVCALQHCKSAKGRTDARCVERVRVEEARQRRMERE